MAYFGETVANIVMEETDDKTLPKAERKQKQVGKLSKNCFLFHFSPFVKLGEM